MEEDVFPDPLTIKATERFVPYRLDSTKDAALIKKLHPIGTPIFYFIDADENVIGHMFGPIAPEFYDRWTRVVAESAKRRSTGKVATEKPILKVIDAAFALDLPTAMTALSKCNLKEEDASVRDEALMALAQAQLLNNQVDASLKTWQALIKLTKDAYMKSNALSNHASMQMMSNPEKSYSEFKSVSDNKSYPEIDRWCAAYQMKILEGMKKRKGGGG